MRTLTALALIAVLGAAALGYAWHVLGKLPAREAAAPQSPTSSPDSPDSPNASPDAPATHALEPEPLEARSAAEPQLEAPTVRAPVGFEEGGLAPLVRDYEAIYADRTREERSAALVRLKAEIFVARQALGPAELDELAGRSGNRPTTPGVARLLALIEERAWVQASLATQASEDGR